ncbi:uroporphyrinogen-III C-methyltransferase [Cryptococcus wingfieldii CBS 7118]|uniref:Uroporphyrinogen-III C-methyltransferase n=1 Tax=Cryptococcus wingfieldii CBS 7118 TaxID=1295528 RepID=A0A1E3HLT0_9TREE|nr:uroporphyrinogen-III C-methyltransferase [Cryptococcus wingfieldii CBS 7118]ODN76401.1 uroporphyrinogen-III C-methyltransferase [Cryptococcus wingfieldii CBS 7118]
MPPSNWISLWMAAASIVVAWDVAYCLCRPRSFAGGDLAWIWKPDNNYGEIDYIYGWKAYNEGDGFTAAQATLNLLEVTLAVIYLYLRHSSPRHSSAPYHSSALLVGFASALMTWSKTVLYILQEYLCGWCNVGHNDRWTFWCMWVIPNCSWIVFPGLITLALGSHILSALQRDSIAQHPSAPSPSLLVPTPAGLTKAGLTKKGKPALTQRQDPNPTHTLPLTFHPHNLPTLIIGSNKLAASRATTFLSAGALVHITSPLPLVDCAKEVQVLVEGGKVEYERKELGTEREWREYLEEKDVALACVTSTLISPSTPSPSSPSPVSQIHNACLSLHIPLNTSDSPNLSTYTFPSTHRFPSHHPSTPSALTISVSSGGLGCRMSGRIRREVVSSLGQEVGRAVDNVGRLREKAKAFSKRDLLPLDLPSLENQEGPLNSPVPQIPTRSLSPSSSIHSSSSAPFPKALLSESEQQLRRMRWVYQMSEYYSFEHLARMSEDEMDKALEIWGEKDYGGELPHHLPSDRLSQSQEGEEEKPVKKGRILLVGSGPGHPSLLTLSAHHALTTSTLILSDKLVPSQILALIPPSVKVHVAKKFPGNAEGAQNEMMQLALEGALRGETVVRLKQGDPFVYGRGGEEVLFFRKHGFESTVIPGISSALAAPLMMNIPVTQRGVAESLILCTGVGRQGRAVQLPGYVRSRTLVLLMGVARIQQIVDTLLSPDSPGRDGAAFPPHLPIAIIERASSPDQRLTLSTLSRIAPSLAELDERPPGMIVVGWAALALEGKGRVDILDMPEEGEEAMVREWLAEEGREEEGWKSGEGWKVREGLNEDWKGILSGVV